MHQQKLDAARWILSIIFLLGAAVIGGLALPMWRGKVEPNDTYGVRTKKTLADPALWYRANSLVGRNLVIFSGTFAFLVLLMHFTIARSNFVLAVSFLAGILLVGMAAIAIHGIRLR